MTPHRKRFQFLPILFLHPKSNRQHSDCRQGGYILCFLRFDGPNYLADHTFIHNFVLIFATLNVSPLPLYLGNDSLPPANLSQINCYTVNPTSLPTYLLYDTKTHRISVSVFAIQSRRTCNVTGFLAQNDRRIAEIT